MRVLLLLGVTLGLGCGASDAEEQAPECLGSPTCTLVAGECCGDRGFVPVCVDGEWICDPCAPEGEAAISACESQRSMLTSECEVFYLDVIRDGGSPAACGL